MVHPVNSIVIPGGGRPPRRHRRAASMAVTACSRRRVHVPIGDGPVLTSRMIPMPSENEDFQGNVRIHDYVDTDGPDIWPIIHEVVSAGETYAYDQELSPEQTHDVWVAAPPGHTTVASDGAQVQGTARMGPNRPGPGSHVATASFRLPPMRGSLGSAGHSANTHFPGPPSRVRRHAVQRLGGTEPCRRAPPAIPWHHGHWDRSRSIRAPCSRPRRSPRHAPVPLIDVGTQA